MVHQVTDVVEAIDKGFGRVTRLHTDGGPTRSNDLMQWLADLVDRPVLRATQAELSALGVAHMAGLQAGLWTWDELRAMNRNSDRFQPSLAEGSRKDLREAWLGAVNRARMRRPTRA
jgi:glycerol kinase